MQHSRHPHDQVNAFDDPFTARHHESVSAWGEEKLITAIRRWLGRASPRAPFGIGDDCAVLRASRGRQLITVDPVPNTGVRTNPGSTSDRQATNAVNTTPNPTLNGRCTKMPR